LALLFELTSKFFGGCSGGDSDSDIKKRKLI